MRPIGLDATAVMLMANAARVDTALLVEILPSIEAAIVAPRDTVQDEENDDDDT